MQLVGIPNPVNRLCNGESNECGQYESNVVYNTTPLPIPDGGSSECLEVFHGRLSANASVYDGGDEVSPGSPSQTAVRRTEWFGGGLSRHWLGDARRADGHTAKETTICETVRGSYGNGGLAAWEVGEAEGPSVALRGPTMARGS